MTLTDAQVQELRAALEQCARPLIFFDGDTDGLGAFALFYRFCKEGKGVMIGGKPFVGAEYARKVLELNPDVIFVVDMPLIEQEFLDAIDTPLYWLDHHDPHHGLRLKKNQHYFNPRIHDITDGRPTSYWAYKVTGQDLWIAMTGIVGDYAWELVHEFREAYPGLLPIDIMNQGQALFSSRLGDLIRILNFNLKGSISSSMTSVKVFTRIEDPYEILDGTTTKGKFLLRKAETVAKPYKRHLDQIISSVLPERFLVYVYDNEQFSFSGDLANEVKWRYPDKIVLIGRRHDGKVMMSVRSETIPIVDAVKSALDGLNGYGGGHPLACGAVVAEQEFDEFLERFKKACGGRDLNPRTH